MKDYDNLGIAQLQGQSSFPQWKQSLMDALDSLELSGWVTGQRKAPLNPGAAPDELDNPSRDADAAYEAALDKYSAWFSKDAKARIILRQSATPILAAEMKGSAKDMFETMCARFDNGVSNFRDTLYQDFLSMECLEDEIMDEYVLRWTETLITCLQVGFEFDESRKVELFINNLENQGGPTDWTEGMSEEMRGPGTHTLDSVIKSFIQHWETS